MPSNIIHMALDSILEGEDSYTVATRVLLVEGKAWKRNIIGLLGVSGSGGKMPKISALSEKENQQSTRLHEVRSQSIQEKMALQNLEANPRDYRNWKAAMALVKRRKKIIQLTFKQPVEAVAITPFLDPFKTKTFIVTGTGTDAPSKKFSSLINAFGHINGKYRDCLIEVSDIVKAQSAAFEAVDIPTKRIRDHYFYKSTSKEKSQPLEKKEKKRFNPIPKKKETWQTDTELALIERKPSLKGTDHFLRYMRRENKASFKRFYFPSPGWVMSIQAGSLYESRPKRDGLLVDRYGLWQVEIYFKSKIGKLNLNSGVGMTTSELSLPNRKLFYKVNRHDLNRSNKMSIAQVNRVFQWLLQEYGNPSYIT